VIRARRVFPPFLRPVAAVERVLAHAFTTKLAYLWTGHEALTSRGKHHETGLKFIALGDTDDFIGSGFIPLGPFQEIARGKKKEHDDRKNPRHGRSARGIFNFAL